MPKIGERFNPRKLFEVIMIAAPIAAYKGLSPGAKLVWGRLYRYSGENGEIYPAVKTVANELGMSESQARRYLHELVSCKFLEAKADPGRTNDYFFLWHSALDGDTGDIRMAPPLSDATGGCGVSDATGVSPVGCYTTPLSDATDERADLNSDALREENPIAPLKPLDNVKPLLAPAPSPLKSFITQSDLQLEDDIWRFTKNVYNHAPRRVKLKPIDERRWRDKLEQIERADTPELVRAALLNFLSRSDDEAVEKKWPIGWFVKSIARYMPEPAMQSPRHVPTRTSSEAPATAPEPFTAANSDPSRNPLTYIEQWNTIVYESPVDADAVPSFTMANLKKAINGGDFQKCFERVCEKCQRMNTNKPDTVTFDGLFMGFVPLWQEIYAGKHDWKMGKEDAMSRAIAAAEREERGGL